MSTFARPNRRVDDVKGERMPNMPGMVLCTLISLPIWVGILALIL